MTSYWCELAWLGGEQAEPGVVIALDGERIGSVATGVASPPPDATRLEGLTIPGLANAHSHAFQRALRGRTQAGAGSFWTWREQMYGRPPRSTPTATGRWPGRPSARWRWPGSPRWASSTTSTTVRTGSPTPTRTPWGAP